MKPPASPRSPGTSTTPKKTATGEPGPVDLSEESVAGEEDPGAALDEPEAADPVKAPAKPARPGPLQKR